MNFGLTFACRSEGLQQDLYDFIIKKTKEYVFVELTDLLAEASWMSE